MMMVAAAVALLVPAAALADAPKPTIETGAARPGEHLICQYMYHQGTILGRAVCKTEHAWIRSRIRQQADVRDFQIRALTGVGGR
jgi:hypothetical protein